LLACAARNPDLQVVGQVDVGDDLQAIISKADVVIDFSFHSVTPAVAALCAQEKKPLVIGTTGHSPTEQEAIRSSQGIIPIVWASNYSTGVNTLFWLTRKAAEILGPEFDLEIIEMHHRLKKDAPSGTATTLAEILDEVRQHQLNMRHGRKALSVSAPRMRLACTPFEGEMWSEITRSSSLREGSAWN